MQGKVQQSVQVEATQPWHCAVLTAEQNKDTPNVKPQDPAMPCTLKRSETESEMSNIRRSFEVVCIFVDDFKEQSKSIDKRIAELLTIIKSKDKRILRLEEQKEEHQAGFTQLCHKDYDQTKARHEQLCIDHSRGTCVYVNYSRERADN